MRRLIPALLSVLLLFAVPSRAALPTPQQVIEWVDKGELDRLAEGAFTFAQITDAHLDPKSKPPAVGAPAATRAALQEIKNLYPTAGFVVFTGDNGIGFFEEVLQTAPLPVYVVNGNRTTMVPGHPVDGISRDYFTDMKWIGDHTADMKAVLTASDQVENAYVPAWYRRDVGRNVFLFLQTAAPDHEGSLRPDQLGWLHRQLSDSAEKNIFLFSHHSSGYLMSYDFLSELLQHHRPRHRNIVQLCGHTHGLGYQETAGSYILTSPNMNGPYRPYRVVHVRDDCIITYVRLSETARRQDAEAAGQEYELPKNMKTYGWTGAFTEGGIMTNSVRVIPLKDVAAKPENEKASEWARFIDWPGNREPENGEALHLVFDRTNARDAEFRVMDRSTCGNDLYINGLFSSRYTTPQFTWSSYRQKYPGYVVQPYGAPSQDAPIWTEASGRKAIVCGFYEGEVPMGANGMYAWDSYSLNTPAVRNSLTLEAEVLIPEQPVGFAYDIADKGSFKMGFTADGKVRFSLLLRREGLTRPETRTLETPEPLSAGQWHRISGTFDGEIMRLYLDGTGVAEGKPVTGSQLAPFRQSLYVNGSYSNSIYAVRRTKGYKTFLLHSLRLSNRAEKITP